MGSSRHILSSYYSLEFFMQGGWQGSFVCFSPSFLLYFLYDFQLQWEKCLQILLMSQKWYSLVTSARSQVPSEHYRLQNDLCERAQHCGSWSSSCPLHLVRNCFYQQTGLIYPVRSPLTNFTLPFLTISTLGMLSSSQILVYNGNGEILQTLQAS